MKFNKLTINDIPVIKPYFKFSKSRACDNSVGVALMWREYFNTEFAFCGETLVFKVKYEDGKTAFTYPLGKDPEGALAEIEAYCKENNIGLHFCAATKAEIDSYKAYFENVEVTPTPMWNDYLYTASDLAFMKGKRYNGQRNHINFFLRTNPDWSFEEITPANVAEVKEYFSGSSYIDSKDSEIFYEEQAKVFEVLDNFEAYNLFGGILRVSGKIIAFSIGEIVKDTLFVHIEKAEASVRGSYQMIVREFASHYCRDGVEFINREDDAGDEGLRRSKLSYHPVEMIEKHFVTVKL